MKASANGTLPAHARQVMYAARPTILENARDTLGNPYNLRSDYFTQTILTDYITEDRQDWHVVFDARGHLTEPHTKRTVPLGKLDVRRYNGKMRKKTDDDTWNRVKKAYLACGPNNRYAAVLFIEKVGFLPLFEAVKLAERYDICVMSTKGAARASELALARDATIPERWQR